MTPNHAREPQKNAFHSLGGQLYVRQRGDGARAQAITIVQPEDDAIAFEVWARGADGEGIVDLPEKYAAVHGGGRTRGGSHREQGGRIRDSLSHPGATLFGESGLEMIVGNVAGNDFQEAEDRVWMARLERSEEPAVVVAELEIGILNEVIESLTGLLAEAVRGAKDGRGNDRLKTADEFPPYSRVLRTGTCFD